MAAAAAAAAAAARLLWQRLLHEDHHRRRRRYRCSLTAAVAASTAALAAVVRAGPAGRLDWRGLVGGAAVGVLEVAGGEGGHSLALLAGGRTAQLTWWTVNEEFVFAASGWRRPVSGVSLVFSAWRLPPRARGVRIAFSLCCVSGDGRCWSIFGGSSGSRGTALPGSSAPVLPQLGECRVPRRAASRNERGCCCCGIMAIGRTIGPRADGVVERLHPWLQPLHPHPPAGSSMSIESDSSTHNTDIAQYFWSAVQLLSYTEYGILNMYYRCTNSRNSHCSS